MYLIIIINNSRVVDHEVRSNASSSIFDREFLGPLPWEEIHKIEDDYFNSEQYLEAVRQSDSAKTNER